MLYVVSGLMRSGTSMMMRCLSLGGLEPVYEKGKQSAYLNIGRQNGYYSNKYGIYELDWSFVDCDNISNIYSGKLIKIFANILIQLPETLGMKIVFLKRNVEEINASLLKFGMKKKYNFFDAESFIDAINKREDVLSLDVFQYHDILLDPLKYFQTLKNNGWKIDCERCVKGVDNGLCHFKF